MARPHLLCHGRKSGANELVSMRIWAATRPRRARFLEEAGLGCCDSFRERHRPAQPAYAAFKARDGEKVADGYDELIDRPGNGMQH